MSFFKRDQVKKSSLDAFKTTASAIDDAAALEKITGGLLSGCHTGGKLATASSLSRVSIASFSVAAMI